MIIKIILKGNDMDYTLANIESDKRDRIINAAINEFSLYPYDKASTNNIVKNAGISKGLLFHYFENKQELYEKLIGFVLNKITNELRSHIDLDQNYILDIIKQLIVFKMELGKIYPKIFDFIVKVLSDKKTNSMDDVMNFYEKYGVDIHGMLGDIYTRNIDYSKFKDQKNIDKSINIVRWTLEKFSEERLVGLDENYIIDYDQVSLDIDSYINVLKSTLYN